MSQIESLGKHYKSLKLNFMDRFSKQRKQNSKQDFRLTIPNLFVPEEGISVISGVSGSGKSSFLRLLMGLDSPDSGSWVVKGQDLLSLPVNKRNLGVVFQDYRLFPHLTVRENIAVVATTKNSTNDIVEELGLEHCQNRLASIVSGGEAQRTALARALVNEPSWLMLDEPFSALDSENRSKARLHLRKITKSKNIPTLLITHDLEDVVQLADYEIEFNEGKVVRSGPKT